MKSFWTLAVAVAIMTVIGPAVSTRAESDGWRRYTNRRTGASAEYPSALVADGPSVDVRDGRTGSAIRPPVGIRLSNEEGLDIGIFGVEAYGGSPRDYLCENGCPQESYTVNKPNISVVSGRNANRIYYKKCIRPAGTQALHCFDLEYPNSLTNMDPIIGRMSRSLH